MNIELKNLPENSTVSLLAEVIKNQQNSLNEEVSLRHQAYSEKENLSRLYSEKAKQLEDANERITILSQEKEELEADVSSKEDEITTQKSKINSLNEDIDSLQTEVSQYRNQVNEYKIENEKLRQALVKSNAECTSLREALVQKEKECSELSEKVKLLTSVNKELSSELKVYEFRFCKAELNTLVLVLRATMPFIKEPSFNSFVESLISDIETFSSQLKDLDDFKFRLKGKDCWITRLASLYWWCRNNDINADIPLCLNGDSVLYTTFGRFIDYLSANELSPNIPNGAFTSSLVNYQPDYDDQAALFKLLFPNYKNKDFVLCQVTQLSFNTETGMCSGINAQ